MNTSGTLVTFREFDISAWWVPGFLSTYVNVPVKIVDLGNAKFPVSEFYTLQLIDAELSPEAIRDLIKEVGMEAGKALVAP